LWFFFFQAEDGIRDFHVTGVQTCALPIFFEAYGFEKDMDLYAFYLDVASLDTERFDRVVSYAMRKYKFRIDRFDRKQLEREIRRSEERRVGKEGRAGWAGEHWKKRDREGR